MPVAPKNKKQEPLPTFKQVPKTMQYEIPPDLTNDIAKAEELVTELQNMADRLQGLITRLLTHTTDIPF